MKLRTLLALILIGSTINFRCFPMENAELILDQDLNIEQIASTIFKKIVSVIDKKQIPALMKKALRGQLTLDDVQKAINIHKLSRSKEVAFALQFIKDEHLAQVIHKIMEKKLRLYDIYESINIDKLIKAFDLKNPNKNVITLILSEIQKAAADYNFDISKQDFVNMLTEAQKSAAHYNHKRNILQLKSETLSAERIHELKGAIVGGGILFVGWCAGHAILHPIMEAFEPQAAYTALPLTLLASFGLYKLYKFFKPVSFEEALLLGAAIPVGKAWLNAFVNDIDNDHEQIDEKKESNLDNKKGPVKKAVAKIDPLFDEFVNSLKPEQISKLTNKNILILAKLNRNLFLDEIVFIQSLTPEQFAKFKEITPKGPLALPAPAAAAAPKRETKESDPILFDVD